MKYKLATTYGILSWILIYIISGILNPFIIDDNIPYINIVIPISIIIVTSAFGILYIRNIKKNEVIEGLKLGIIFFIIDLILDWIFFILPKIHSFVVENYIIHILTMIIMIPIITTFIGYLAQMPIDLR